MPGSTAGFREVLLHFLIRERVARDAQLFRRVGDVPGFESVEPSSARARNRFNSTEVALGVGFGARRELVQKLRAPVAATPPSWARASIRRNCAKPSSCASSARSFTISVMSRRVVPVRLAEFGGARARRRDTSARSSPVVGIAHDRQIGGRVQGEFPAGSCRPAAPPRALPQHVIGNAGDASASSTIVGERVGGIEQVVGEA